MERTISIAIASKIFWVSEVAYEKLQAYLEALKDHFRGNDGRDEIMRDIESRIAELLGSKEGVVSLADVQGVISRIGAIEDFEKAENIGVGTIESERVSKVRKLYRNPDDMIIAGVCSGIAAYFGIEATWVRLAFALITFMGGFGILAYVILWIIVPEAATKSQKIEMSGKPVTLETLSSVSVGQAKEIAKRSASGSLRLLAFPFRIVGKILRFLGKILPPIARIIVGAILLFVGMVGLISIMGVSGFLMSGHMQIINDIPNEIILPGSLRYLAVVGGTVAALIPALLVFLAGISLFKKKNVISGGVGLGFLSVWLVALLVSGFGVATIMGNYKEFQRTSPSDATITTSLPLKEEFHGIDISDGLDLQIVQGASTALAVTGRAKDVDSLQARVEKGVLSIRRKDLSPKEDSPLCLICFRESQSLTLVLSAADLNSITAQHNSVVTSEVPLVGDVLTLNVSNGSRVSLEGEAKSMTVAIDHNSRADLSLSAQEIILNLSNGSYLLLSGRAVSANLTLSHNSRLEGVNFEVAGENLTAEITNGSDLSLTAGVKEAAVVLEHNSRADLFLKVGVLRTKAVNGSRLFLEGDASQVTVSLENNSSLEAVGFKVASEEIDVSNGSSARIGILEVLNARAVHNSTVRYSGDPKLTKDADEGSHIGPL